MKLKYLILRMNGNHTTYKWNFIFFKSLLILFTFLLELSKYEMDAKINIMSILRIYSGMPNTILKILGQMLLKLLFKLAS